MERTVKLYAYRLTDLRSWITTAIFVAGNIALPQLCHLIPNGGLILLPIYFFTLVAAYKYGLTVGLLTAVLSPVINHLLFGMPPAGMLAPILIKSVLLAVSAALAAKYFGRVSILGIVAAVLSYQIVGTAAEWLIAGNFEAAVQDFRMGLPGIIIQIFGGWLVLKSIGKI